MGKDWRRAFIRYAAWVMHERFNTSLDIVDASYHQTSDHVIDASIPLQLREDQIILQFMMTSDDSIDVKDLVQAAGVMQDALEAVGIPQITIKPKYIYFIFNLLHLQRRKGE